MTPPPTIPFSSITLGERGRSEYTGIERLADSIRDNGLIQPLVLVSLNEEVKFLKDETCKTEDEFKVVGIGKFEFGLDAGGRRYHALKLRLDRGEWDGTLYHASTSDPERPGYVLKGEQFATPFQRAMTEIAENLDRSDPDWRDQVKMIVRAWKLAQSEHHANGEDILMRDFGSMIGVEYTKLQAAITVHDELIANPEKFKDCGGIRAACTKLLKMNEVELTKELAQRSLIQVPQLVQKPTEAGTVSVQSEPEPLAATKPIVIPLTTAFIRCDSLDYMAGLPGPTFDHIICDPDYGVSVERLEANMDTGSGVAQATVSDSLETMRKFVPLAWKTIRDQGFLVMWYDLDHHEKLQALATSVGFAVQRWPLIWHKMDYRSNAAPAYNFTKNVEYAMVCRKPNAVLARAQTSTIYSCPSGTTARDFNHPFAKPVEVWKWVYSATCIKGQTVFDPFCGSGSASVAAMEWDLKAVGCELDSGHYATLLLNLQTSLRKRLPNITFS